MKFFNSLWCFLPFINVDAKVLIILNGWNKQKWYVNWIILNTPKSNFLRSVQSRNVGVGKEPLGGIPAKQSAREVECPSPGQPSPYLEGRRGREVSRTQDPRSMFEGRLSCAISSQNIPMRWWHQHFMKEKSEAEKFREEHRQ